MFFVKNRKTQHPVKMADISIRNWLARSPANRALSRVLQCWKPDGHLHVDPCAFSSSEMVRLVKGPKQTLHCTYSEDTGLNGQTTKESLMLSEGDTSLGPVVLGRFLWPPPLSILLPGRFPFMMLHDALVTNRGSSLPQLVNSKEKPNLRLKC